MRPGSKDKVKKEFDELLLEVRRVTRVTTGGRKMSFRATILVGNKKGKIGIGVSKGPDVQSAVSKASREAYKNMFLVPITGNQTVPYATTTKYKACMIKLLPATAGTGLKAGSSVRAVLELAGFENMLSKIMGSNNKLNNAMATIIALSSYKYADHFNKRVVQKVKHEDTEEKEAKHQVSSAVTEITAKREAKVAVEAKAEAKKSATPKVEKIEVKKPAAKKTVAKKEDKPAAKKTK
ncbi:MAG: hypothetical protein WC010_03710 [Candidatus Absconditabacterales bacterium]